MSKTEKHIDSILEDWSADEIREKFDFMFQQTLEMSDGMMGADLAELFEVQNKIVGMFRARESELALVKTAVY
jgi:hypothetical protein